MLSSGQKTCREEGEETAVENVGINKETLKLLLKKLDARMGSETILLRIRTGGALLRAR
jgi:hypothetical protein